MTERNIPAGAPETEEQMQIDGEARVAPARPRDKVVAAVTALTAVGKLKSWHSDSEVRKIRCQKDHGARVKAAIAAPAA